MKILPREFKHPKAKLVTESSTAIPKGRKEPSQQASFSDSLVLLKCFANRITKDLFFGPQAIEAQSKHLAAAISWLKLAHDITLDNGVSWGYSLKGQWRTSYRETSGYIAVTFFDLAKQLKDEDSWQRALAISQWLANIQNADGSISNPRYSSEGIVFDTGQVLPGLVRAFEETQNQLFLRAAQRSGDWLVKVADSEGCWTRNTHFGIPHVYNTRVSWSLLKLNSLKPNSEWERVGRANLDWALSQQKNGWFEQCAFIPGVPPFTHTIAYAIRGLLESGLLLSEQKYIEAAVRGAEAMMTHVGSDGFIPGQIDTDGRAQGRYCCLTGNCQMAIIWLKLFQLTGDRRYHQAASNSLGYVMS
ncbi:MAG: hypothetical protein WA919_22195, partial [Coleofasciculaceae cyanobacterium]